MSEEERKARNMRESVGVKDWIAQSKDGSTHSHQGKELFAFPSVWQKQDRKHSQATVIKRQAIGPRNVVGKIPKIQAN